MKRLFLAICLICLAMPSFARVSDFNEAAREVSQEKKIETLSTEGLPDPNNLEEVRSFFKKRFQNAIVTNVSELGDLNKTNSMDVQHSAEYIQDMKENEKSVFQKIYEQALGRIDKNTAEFSPDTVFYEEVKIVPSEKGIDLPDIAVVDVTLPNGKKILAPAMEHIPYLLSSYAIQPTGVIDVEEDVVVIANSQKLRNGLFKILPKYTTSRTGVKKKLDMSLISVSINGKEVPHKLQEIGDNIYIKPNQDYVLAPGIYSYHFHYLLDRKLWYYDDFTEFYTDVAGSYLNLVIASANAIISVPDGKTFTSATVMTGYRNKLSLARALVAYLDKNALGVASTTPLNAGEGLHVLVSLDKDVFIAPTFGRRFVWFVTDYGDILFALLGLIAVFGSYYMSWKYIKKNKSQSHVRFKQTAALNRYMSENLMDKRSFVSSLLELYRYKIIDLKKEDGHVLLIKKTDQFKNCPSVLKKLAQVLFGKQDSSLAVSEKNFLKLQRAQNILKKNVEKTFKFLTWRLNGMYLAFSLTMLVLTCLCISYIAINPIETGLILLLSVLTLSFYIWVLRRSYTNKVAKYVIKALAALFVLGGILLLSVYIHFLSALLILCIVWIIFKYSALFSAKNGLIKSKLQDIENLKKYLMANAEYVSKSIEFELNQANIFAFSLENHYGSNEKNKKVYKLDLASEILKEL